VESELDFLLGGAINSLPKLEILVHFQQEGSSVRSPAEIGVRLRRPTGEITTALEELAHAGLVDRFALGTGRHVLYGARNDTYVQQVLQVLYARYQDPDARRQLLQHALGQGGNGDSDS
jgi:hypothetical protein